jgi:hypothetical protein
MGAKIMLGYFILAFLLVGALTTPDPNLRKRRLIIVAVFVLIGLLLRLVPHVR